MDEERKKEIVRLGFSRMNKQKENLVSLLIVLVGLISGLFGAFVGVRPFLFYFGLALFVVAANAGLRWAIRLVRIRYARN